MGNCFSAGAVEEDLTGDQTNETQTQLSPSGENTGSAINDSHSDTDSTNNAENAVSEDELSAKVKIKVKISLFNAYRLKGWGWGRNMHGQNILIVGRGKSEKTKLANHLSSKLCADNIVFTKNVNHRILDEVLYEQKNKKGLYLYPPLTIIFENIPCDNINLKYALRNSRSLCITGIVTTDETSLKDEELKSLFDYVFIFAESDKKKLDEIYENYLYMVPYYLYEPIFTTYTANLSTIVVDKTVKSNIIENQVFWYRE